VPISVIAAAGLTTPRIAITSVAAHRELS
jgi:hypothetical protein